MSFEKITLAAQRTGRVYLAGPMTGYQDLNFPAFNAEAARLRGAGWHVENPAEHGIVDAAEWGDYLRYDIYRLATCEAIHLLPGWHESKGAQLEIHIAMALGMDIRYAHGATPAAPAEDAPQFSALDMASARAEGFRDGVASLPAGVPEGYVLAPARMELLPEDIAAIMFHCGGDEDATEIDEQYQGGLLWIGEVSDDDGNKLYGLNIASIECLEEGSTPLVEFAAPTVKESLSVAAAPLPIKLMAAHKRAAGERP